MAAKIKIRIPLLVEVDPEQWDAAYGTGTSAAEVRADVRSYFLNAAQYSPAASETGAEISEGR